VRRPYLTFREFPGSPTSYTRTRQQLRHDLEAAYPDLIAGIEEEQPSRFSNDYVREHIDGKRKRAFAGYMPVLLRGQTRLGGRLVTVVGRTHVSGGARNWVVEEDSLPATNAGGATASYWAERLQLYGWLFEQTFGVAPIRLSVGISFTPRYIRLEYDGGRSARKTLKSLWRLVTADEEPWTPVGKSKCKECVFRERCAQTATAAGDISLVAQELAWAEAFHDAGIETAADLLQHDESSLAEIELRVNGEPRLVGPKRSQALLARARIAASGKPEWRRRPVVPESHQYAMFDIEDYRGAVYLWGLQVFGDRQGEYLGRLGNLFSDPYLLMGLRGRINGRGWTGFLTTCQTVFREYGDIPFVHYGAHERSTLRRYVERFGDPRRIASRVERNLLDLLPIVKGSVTLPEYGLKYVERVAGFSRGHPEFDARWAEALLKTADGVVSKLRWAKRQRGSDREGLLGAMGEVQAQVEQIPTYNEDDLKATWTVLCWLRAQSAPPDS